MSETRTDTRTARARLGAAQAELLRALTAKAPAPAGFDAPGVAAEASTLARKRLRVLVKVRPALARLLGRRLSEDFGAYAKEYPSVEQGCADGAAFMRWFLERLGDADVLASLDWQVGLRAVLAAGARRPGDAPLPPPVAADLELFHAVMAEIPKRRGPDALEEPELKAALVTASLQALGVDLDREQIQVLRSELGCTLATLAEEATATAAPATLLEAALASLRTSLAVERAFACALRRDQLTFYLARTGENPYLGRRVPRRRVSAGSGGSLAAAVVAAWTELFLLEASSLAAARELAEWYAREAARVPAAPLEPALRRGGLIARAAALLELQRRAEEALAETPAVTAPDRARIAGRRGAVLLELDLGTTAPTT